MLSYKREALLILSIIIVFFQSACRPDMKFDKVQWGKMSDGFPPECRERMLSDLTTNYKLKGLKYNELVALIGAPNTQDSNSIVYNIIVDYGGDIDPVYTKTLEFGLSKDSIVAGFQIKEYPGEN